ncbi:lipoprotein ABC transporter permease [Clavibacter michiganensis]|uniref:Lipoprotein ABC transporter permease n=2 Tax=Clavibacter TaxID=1573 RepID=A0A399NY59_9MICO|nr:lipoprotein ABC transporter permease [Clavibacter michiganensis]
MIAGMCAAVLLTTGRTVGAQQSVLDSIDAEGTRSIVVRAQPEAELDASVLTRLSGIHGIQWAGGFGPAIDATNAQIADGNRVPVRLAYGTQLPYLGISGGQLTNSTSLWASPEAIRSFGMEEVAGGVVTSSGESFDIVGTVTPPDYLSFMEPLAIAPQASPSGDLAVLVVVASEPNEVAAVTDAVVSVLAVSDPTKVSISTSESLADLRGLIQGQLGFFSQNLVVLIFSLTATLVAAILYGLVMLRRKDFGRRRALGASRGLIIALLLIQIGLLSAVGGALGSGVASLSMVVSADPLPSFAYFLAVAILATAVGVIAAVVPAIAAARRDPLKELRVP